MTWSANRRRWSGSTTAASVVANQRRPRGRGSCRGPGTRGGRRRPDTSIARALDLLRAGDLRLAVGRAGCRHERSPPAHARRRHDREPLGIGRECVRLERLDPYQPGRLPGGPRAPLSRGDSPLEAGVIPGDLRAVPRRPPRSSTSPGSDSRFHRPTRSSKPAAPVEHGHRRSAPARPTAADGPAGPRPIAGESQVASVSRFCAAFSAGRRPRPASRTELAGACAGRPSPATVCAPGR